MQVWHVAVLRGLAHSQVLFVARCRPELMLPAELGSQPGSQLGLAVGSSVPGLALQGLIAAQSGRASVELRAR